MGIALRCPFFSFLMTLFPFLKILWYDSEENRSPRTVEIGKDGKKKAILDGTKEERVHPRC